MSKTQVRLKFPAQFSRYINDVESVEFEGNTVADFVDYLEVSYGNIKARLFDAQGNVRPYLNIFIGRKNINALDGLNSRIPDGENISLLLSRAGG